LGYIVEEAKTGQTQFGPELKHFNREAGSLCGFFALEKAPHESKTVISTRQVESEPAKVPAPTPQ